MDEIRNLPELFSMTVKKYKRKEALLYEGKTITYKELDENSNKAANALKNLGLESGDRIALMLPNIPEFVYSFLAIQKIGAVAVPFNTMYKGREITHILNDSGAKAIICLSNFANLINEIRDDAPALEHVILTGQRTIIPITPESTVNIQMVVGKDTFDSPEQAFRDVGELLVDTLKSFGIDAWYKHRGGVRVGGKKIATVLVSELESIIMVNTIIFVGPMAADELFKVMWVPPEIKDKVLEPSTSVLEETGEKVGAEEFSNAFLGILKEKVGIEAEKGSLKRDELFGYEKTITLSKY